MPPAHPSLDPLPQRVATFDELVGRNMLFKVTEVDEEKARLMLSNKRIAADDRMGSFKVRAPPMAARAASRRREDRGQGSVCRDASP